MSEKSIETLLEEYQIRIIKALGDAYANFNRNFFIDANAGNSANECCYQTASNIFKGAIYTVRDTK